MEQTQSSLTRILDKYARNRGVCFLGETGAGVSYTLTSLMKQDVQADKRVLLLDPYGDLIQKLKEIKSDTEVWQIGAKKSRYFIDLFNAGDNNDSSQVAEAIIDLMYMLFDPNHTGVIGPRFEHAIRNTVIALLDAGQGSFINIVKMLTDTDYLNSIIPLIKHEGVRIYFTDQLAKTSDFHKSEVLDYIVSKLSVFIDPTSFIGNITNGTDRKSFINLIADSKGTVGLDLSELSKQPSHLSAIANRLISRQLSQLMKDKNKNFSNTVLYIDEANRFDHEHIDEIITHSRRQGVEVIYTVRTLSLLRPEAQYVYLAGKSIITYRIPPPDARALKHYFDGFRDSKEIASLSNFHYLARMRTAEGVHFIEG